MSKLRDAAFNADDTYFKDVRLERAKPKKYKMGHRNRGRRKKYSRCPECGGMVTKPCILCHPSGDIIASRRTDGHGKVFKTMEDFAVKIKEYTAGSDLDKLAKEIEL